MRFSGGIYIGEKGRRYRATYNYNHDIHNSPEPGAKSVAHFSYTRGNKQGGGDIFQEQDLSKQGISRINENKTIKVSPKTCQITQEEKTAKLKTQDLESETPQKYDVQIQLQSDLPPETKREITLATLADIEYFCGQDTAESHRGHRIEDVGKIVPITKVKEITPRRLIDGGKNWFVPECLLSANIDFGKGCATSFIPGENATFNGETFQNYFFAPWAECAYPCYASRFHKSFPKTKHKIDESYLEKLLLGDFEPDFQSTKKLGHPVEILRFGKRTESYNSLFHDSFIKTLQVMKSTGTRGIIPTKFLPYDKQISKLLKQTKSVLLYGIGFDNLEKGAVLNGHENAWRLEQLAEYKADKVNAAMYLHIAADAPPTPRDIQMLNLGYKTQLLPLRFKTKKTLHEVTGRYWDALTQTAKEPSLFNDTVGHEVHKQWAVSFVHPEWERIIGNNNGKIRMCHHNSQKTYCGKCFQGKGLIK